MGLDTRLLMPYLVTFGLIGRNIRAGLDFKFIGLLLFTRTTHAVDGAEEAGMLMKGRSQIPI
jgi:hypothetical protein